MDTLKQKILTIIEKNSRIDMKELAVLLGTGEVETLNAMQEMQDEGIICGYHTMSDWEKTGVERVTALIGASTRIRKSCRAFSRYSSAVLPSFPEGSAWYVFPKSVDTERGAVLPPLRYAAYSVQTIGYGDLTW